MMDLGTALLHLREGRCVRRASWPEGACLALLPGMTVRVEEGSPMAAAFGVGRELITTPITVQIVNGAVALPWSVSPIELHTNDWQITDPPASPAPPEPEPAQAKPKRKTTRKRTAAR